MTTMKSLCKCMSKLILKCDVENSSEVRHYIILDLI